MDYLNELRADLTPSPEFWTFFGSVVGMFCLMYAAPYGPNRYAWLAGFIACVIVLLIATNASGRSRRDELDEQG